MRSSTGGGPSSRAIPAATAAASILLPGLRGPDAAAARVTAKRSFRGSGVSAEGGKGWVAVGEGG